MPEEPSIAPAIAPRQAACSASRDAPRCPVAEYGPRAARAGCVRARNSHDAAAASRAACSPARWISAGLSRALSGTAGRCQRASRRSPPPGQPRFARDGRDRRVPGLLVAHGFFVHGDFAAGGRISGRPWVAPRPGCWQKGQPAPGTGDACEQPAAPGLLGAAELAAAPCRSRVGLNVPGPFHGDGLGNHRMHHVGSWRPGRPPRALLLALSLPGTTLLRRRTHRSVAAYLGVRTRRRALGLRLDRGGRAQTSRMPANRPAGSVPRR